MAQFDDPEDTLAWLRLIRAPGLGGQRIRELLARFGDARTAVSASRSDLRSVGLPAAAIDAITRLDDPALRQDLAWLAAPDHHLLRCTDADFPPLLERTPLAPAALFVAGDPTLLWFAQVGIVGSRNPTAGGRDNAREFARALARSGLVITSGLADGIDAAAHAATLEAGGRTIAVIGTGPDLVYPARNRALSEAIAAQGALVSEHPPGTEARREHFPRRNRIIAGLSLGTLVVEAALQSGALITARLAAEAGREVFALPGSIHNPLARGCHRLIREGAALVETTQEIVDAMAAQAATLADALRGRLESAPAARDSSSVPGRDDLDPDYRQLWEALGEDHVAIDTLASRTGLTVENLSSMLLLMELDGRVSAAHGRYARRRT